MLQLETPKKLSDLKNEALAELAGQLAALGARVEMPARLSGGETVIDHLAAAADVGPGGLTFAVAPKYLEEARSRGAAAVIVPPELDTEALRLPALVTPEPRLLFSVMLGLAGRRLAPRAPAGQVFFADRASVELGEGVVLGPGVYVGAGVTIGRGTVVMAMSYLEDGVTIGEDCLIHPRVVLRRGVSVGRRCQIHAGAVIGDDGFGYTQVPDPAAGRLWHVKNHHQGAVRIGDDVEIGALAAVDRGLVADTIIEDGVKIDNLVQIGHNCRIRRDCVVVAQTGIGGHTVVGERVFLLGQSGLGPGVTIGADAVISAQAGVGSGAIPPGRELWTGSPARPNSEVYRLRALTASQLPKLRQFFQALKKSETLGELKKLFFAPDDKS